MSKTKEAVFYTDGACSGNPGIGGWAYVELVENKNKSGYEVVVTKGNKEHTTNNEMELTAVYLALVKAFKRGCKKVTVYSDSAYVVNAVKKEWLLNWSNNGWKTKEGKPIKNKNIWEKMHRLIYTKMLQVNMIKVKGHDKDMLNEIADKKAVEAKMELM